MAALRGNRLTNRPSKKNMGQNKGVNRYHRNVKKKKLLSTEEIRLVFLEGVAHELAKE